MQCIFALIILVINQILFKMNTQTQSFKIFETGLLTLKVYNASETSFGVASTIVSGKKETILIDAQFTLADAEIVAREIKNSGKDLTTIYVSHGDPDFYFGLEVFKKYFPEVTAYASPATVEHIKATAQKKLEIWGERLGKNITSNAVLPQVLKGTSLEIEGEKVEIIGLQEFPSKTFVWIPASKAVIGGFNVFGTTFHLWMADAQTVESRKQWISVLEKIETLQPTIVIPAHANSESPFDITAVKHTKDFNVKNYKPAKKLYEEALKTNKTSEGLITLLKEKYPTLTFDIALQIGAKVNTGEMKW